MKRNPLPAQDYLRSRLDYDPETGIFRWKQQEWRNHRTNSWNAKHVGNVAGSLRYGYIVIMLDGVQYGAHRLAWRYIYGSDESLDHRDRNKTNNQISNLRIASLRQNSGNIAKYPHRSLPKGVHRISNSHLYQAKMANTYLGCFKTPEAAHTAYRKAAVEHFGEFACFD